MGTSPRLVKAGAATLPQSQPTVAPQKHFTNWSRQFLAEAEAERASRPSPQAQFSSLFQSKESN